MLNYYQLLGIKTDATPDKIRNAYHKLMRKYHPDISDLPRDEATQKSSEINQAYRTLTDAKKRQDYDNLLKLRGETVVSFKTGPILGEKENERGGQDKKAGGVPASDDAAEKQTSGIGFSDEQFLKLIKDRSAFKRMIDKYYSIHSSRFKPNWANVDMHNYIDRPAQGANSVLKTNLDALDFYDVELSGSNWSELLVERIAFRSCNLKGTNFQGAFIYDCEFSDCDFTGANFTGAFFQNPRKIQKSTFANCRFDKATFRGQIVMIRACNFKGASAQNLQFTDLSGRHKPSLKEQILDSLKEPHWRNINTEEIVAEIESMRPPKKGFWPFGKR
ncbi:DnaJ domain-containing protein [bacterium]|nr:DnaJ domain-containing protein [bacterium]